MKYKPEWHAATTIIGMKDPQLGRRFLLEHKDSGYPVKGFRHTYCLFGGTWINADEKSPLDTLKTEINEEFLGKRNEHARENGELVEALYEGIKPFGEFYIFVPEEISKVKEIRYTVSIFETWIDDGFYSRHRHNLDRIKTTEGRAEIINEDDFRLREHKFTYYQKIMKDYLKNLSVDVRVHEFPGVLNVPLDTDPRTPYSERNLKIYTKVPIGSDLTDESLLN